MTERLHIELIQKNLYRFVRYGLLEDKPNPAQVFVINESSVEKAQTERCQTKYQMTPYRDLTTSLLNSIQYFIDHQRTLNPHPAHVFALERKRQISSKNSTNPFNIWTPIFTFQFSKASNPNDVDSLGVFRELKSGKTEFFFRISLLSSQPKLSTKDQTRLRAKIEDFARAGRLPSP